MKIALITDTHFGVRQDSNVFYEYFEKFYKNCFFPELKERGIQTLIHLGDVFDRRKYCNFLTLHKAKEMFFDKLVEYDIESHFIVGNHDSFFKNTLEVNSLDLILAEYPFNIYSKQTEINIGGLDLLLVPWLIPSDSLKKTNAKVLLGHLEVNSFYMNNSFKCTEGSLDISDLKQFDRVLSGHFHGKSSNKNIDYIGNPFQLNWGDHDSERGFSIFDTETLDLEFIDNPYTIFNKISYNDESQSSEELLNMVQDSLKSSFVKVEISEQRNIHLFNEFVENLERVGVHQISINNKTIFEDVDLDIDMDNIKDTSSILNEFIDKSPNISYHDPEKLQHYVLSELFDVAMNKIESNLQ